MTRILVLATLLTSLALPALAASSSSSSSSSSNSSTNNSTSYSSESHSSHSFSQDDARDAVKAGKVMPLTAILEIVNKRVAALDTKVASAPATVLDAELETEDGVLTYKINLLTDDGRKGRMRLNARTGAVLEFLIQVIR